MKQRTKMLTVLITVSVISLCTSVTSYASTGAWKFGGRGTSEYDASQDEVSAQSAEESTTYSDSETIKSVQELLNKAGYNCGTPDGVKGETTSAAIISYKKDNGLEETDVIDEELLNSLENGNSTNSEEELTVLSEDELKAIIDEYEGVYTLCTIEGEDNPSTTLRFLSLDDGVMTVYRSENEENNTLASTGIGEVQACSVDGNTFLLYTDNLKMASAVASTSTYDLTRALEYAYLPSTLDEEKYITAFEDLGTSYVVSFYFKLTNEYTPSELDEYVKKYKDAVKKSMKAPEIGMTSEEVEKSTWGEPKEINKTTTKYGVHEQWVYGVGKYIYLDDGIVTAIQE